MRSLKEVGEIVRTLKSRVDALEQAASGMKLDLLEQSEWYQLITQKLLPQLSDSSYLVVAVVGGTNIGKSVIFNHLCNGKVSATSPLASGTKHPTCVAPSAWAHQDLLSEIFQEFEVLPSNRAEDPLEASDQDLLFWKEISGSPPNLLLLDTPDIDSDAQINWSRADKVRRSADVLIAVLTQQKYNDAAVKKFFRLAAAEEKTILVLFNQCLLPEDEEYWPIWLEKFTSETGVKPEAVYLAPHDRRAADNNQLAFFHRPWPDAEQSPEERDAKRDLMHDLSRLRFEEIKLRTLGGAIALLSHPAEGIPAYLEEIRRYAGICGDARKRLTERLQEISIVWPTVPNRVVIEEIRHWWKEQRTGWGGAIHGFYDTVGTGLLWPVRKLREVTSTPAPTWEEQYRDQEWQVIQQQLASIFDRLESLSQHGNPVLAPRLSSLLAGHSREEFVQRLRKEHAECNVKEELRQLVSRQMRSFREDQSGLYRLIKRLDTFSAAARPAITVALFATGIGVAGPVVVPMVTDTMLQAAFHVAGDVTAGTVTAAVGDAAIGAGASTGVRSLEAWFFQLHQLYVNHRQSWLLAKLQEHLWGTLLTEWEDQANLTTQPVFRDVEKSLNDVRKLKADFIQG